MSYKYAPAGKDEGTDDAAADAQAFRRAVLANANRGGENVATGALMGALIGGQIGFSRLPTDLVQGLAKSQRPALDKEVEAFLDSVPLLASL